VAAREPQADAARSRVLLGKGFEISPDRPCPELASPGGTAFVAAQRERPSERFFAIIADADWPTRAEMLPAASEVKATALTLPLAWGIVDWPAAGRRSFATVFAEPQGERVVTALTQKVAPLGEDELVRVLLPPLVAGLRDLWSAGLTHRAIRPTNLFRDTVGRTLKLGECVTAPPALAQPVLCEPIESGMALAAGRGNGSAADDVYALGVTVLFLLLGQLPLAAFGDDRILAEKIARGSYGALVGGTRIPAATTELLRGTLADDPRERWSVQDITLWLNGRRALPKQHAQPKRASHPFEFLGQSHHTARTLARAFAADAAAAMAALRGQDFMTWARHSLADEECTKALSMALADDRGAEDRLVGRVCMALDSVAPVRYRGAAVTLDGFGGATLAGLRGRTAVQPIADAIIAGLPQFWCTLRRESMPDHAAVQKNFDRLRVFLEDRRPGFGIERVVYELNPQLRCLSPALESDYILDPGELLPALERISERRRDEDLQIDRHLAAFIAARFRMAGNDWHDTLTRDDPADRALGALYLLGRLQQRYGPASLPALTQRLGRQLPVLIERFHNRARRARLRADLPRSLAKGSLAEVLAFLDSVPERIRDHQGFNQAKRDFAAIERDLELLRDGAPKRPERAAELGARYAAVTANALAWLIALLVLVTRS
jgi:eukaryotic-like serine/threonine-protein kinase